MGRNTVTTLCLLLQLSYQGNTISETQCPARCQCFTPAKVLCSELRMSAMPSDISQVREMVVMTTELTYLNADSFPESPQLAKLVFLNNVLREVSPAAFDPLPGLLELEISGNGWLDRLHPGTFKNQGNLTRLLLNFNRFKTVTPGLFDSLQKLETLQLKGNLISRIPSLLFQCLDSLRSLDLSLNALTSLDGKLLSGLTKLETLRLGFNLITSLSSDSFYNVSQVRELHLDGNRISELPRGIFSNLTQLETLSLRGNLIRNVSQGTFPLSLKELNLKSNRLAAITSDSFTSLTALTHLSLSSNLLQELPADVFRTLAALEWVDLSENQLTSLPGDIFLELSNIKVVHLQNNSLSLVEPKLFEDQTQMEQLYLSWNKLQNLPLGLFDHFLLENVVRLHGNPWSCDCGIQYMYDWVAENHRDVEDLSKVFCAGPGSMKGKSLTSVHKNQLGCRRESEGLDEESPRSSQCTLQTENETLMIRCKVTDSSPLKLKVQLYEEDGNTAEFIVRRETSQCSNDTTSPTV